MIIGIAGGSGSGKTTLASNILKSINAGGVILPMDMYYKDWSYLNIKERENINFDHPDSFDIELLVKHLKLLINGEAIKMPIYDYKTHVRLKKHLLIEAKRIIIVEGLFVLYFEDLRKLLDIKIFIDVEDDVRLIRILIRDIDMRGRSISSIVNQYINFVKPMYNKYVKPTKQFADIIIPYGGYNRKAIDILVHYIKNTQV